MASLLHQEGELTEADNQTHLRFGFSVPAGADRLSVYFEYSPKKLEDEARATDIIRTRLAWYGIAETDEQGGTGWRRFLPLKNLITVSLDDPDLFRGACHRHDERQLLHIGERSASPGLMPGPLPSGEWSITLSVHALVAAPCRYRITIKTEENG